MCPPVLEPVDYLPVLALGVLCALGGIAIMRGVTLVEAWFRRSGVPVWLRPAMGGLIVGGLALWSPQVLSSGHEALRIGLDTPYSAVHIALLIVVKAIASAVSDRLGLPRRIVLRIAVPGAPCPASCSPPGSPP